MSDKGWRVAVIGVIALVAVVSFACGRPTVNDVASPVVPMRQVVDDIGRTVTVPVKITRVVSTAPSVTENVFAVGAGDRLVGVTTFCNYPEEAKAIAKIGDTMTPNMETIIALKPDIVFVSTASQIENFAKLLEQNGIAVYVTNPASLDDVMRNLSQLGLALGTESTAADHSKHLSKRIAAVRNALGTFRKDEEVDYPTYPFVKSVGVFVQISKEPLFTIGRGGFINDLLEIAGGRSVTANVETAFPKLSKETALALQPEAIILSDSPDNQEPNEAFRNSPAVKNGRVYKVNADLLSRPGPRLVDALEQIARDLHPDKFRNN